MAAALPAGMLYFTLTCFPLGVASYVNTFVAQYHGAGRPERIGAIVWQGVWIGLVSAPFFLATIPWAPAMFVLAGHAEHLARAEGVYYQVMTCGAGATIIASALSSFFTGRGQTGVVMVVSVLASLMNMVLDYAWIFGHWGFPALGVAGAAWATVTSEWFRVIAYGWLMLRPEYRRKYRIAEGCRFDRELFVRLMRYGGPNGWQFVVDVAAFSVFLLILGRLGEEAMAATTLAMNINSVAWVPMLGIGIAVSTIVGQRLGEGNPDLAERATWTSLWMALAYTGVIGALYVLFPDWFLFGHASGTSPEQFARLRELTVVLLRFVAGYCMLDAAALIFVSALKGAGDTRFILAVNLWFSAPPVAAVWLGMRLFGGGLYWAWWVLTAWICLLAIVWWLRFVQGRWRGMRVIEPEVEETEVGSGEWAVVSG